MLSLLIAHIMSVPPSPIDATDPSGDKKRSSRGELTFPCACGRKSRRSPRADARVPSNLQHAINAEKRRANAGNLPTRIVPVQTVLFLG